jgi:hypothetical protein
LSKLEYLGKVLLDTRQPNTSAVNAFIARKPDRSKYTPHQGAKQTLKTKHRCSEAIALKHHKPKTVPDKRTKLRDKADANDCCR